MIYVCPTCSGIDVDELELNFSDKNIKCGCIGECGGKDGLVIGYVNGNYIETETEEEFINEIEK